MLYSFFSFYILLSFAHLPCQHRIFGYPYKVLELRSNFLITHPISHKLSNCSGFFLPSPSFATFVEWRFYSQGNKWSTFWAKKKDSPAFHSQRVSSFLSFLFFLFFYFFSSPLIHSPSPTQPHPSTFPKKQKRRPEKTFPVEKERATQGSVWEIEERKISSSLPLLSGIPSNTYRTLHKSSHRFADTQILLHLLSYLLRI